MPKILAIDDKRDNLISLSALIRNLMPECTVITAESGYEGIGKAVHEAPDVILLDVQMPGMDGFETCRGLKAEEKTRSIPVIMITAIRTDAQSRIKGLEIGADAFLSKPIDEQELVSQVKVALRIKAAEDALRRERDCLEEIVLARTAELRESEARFKALHNASFGGITIHDQGVILECNRGLSDLTGYSYEELIGMNGLLLISEKTRDMVVCNIQAGYEQPYEAVGVRKDGEEYPLRLEARNIPYKGQDVRVVEFRDITEQKRIEESLREVNDYLSKLIKYANAPIIVWNTDLRITEFNKAFEQITGLTQAEAVGRHIGILFPEELKEPSLALIRQALHGDHWEVVEIPIQHRNGSIRTVLWNSANIQGQEGQIIATIAQGQDITERKEAEQSLVKAKELAEAANIAKSEFLSNMSHELRTPFNGIMGMMQLLQGTPLDEEQHELVFHAIKSSERFTRLLSDILDLSNIEADKMVICPARFDLGEMLESISGLFTISARQKGIALQCSMDDDVPRQVIGDAIRVKQVLFNLVGNALKFTDQGTVQVHLTALTPVKGADSRIMMSIADTGIGIPDDKFKDLFQPFSQVDGSYTRAHQGAGLGLVIVRRLVALLGGNIDVESVVGQGTTVHVILPFALPALEVSEPVHATSAPGEPKKRLNVLLAEDDPLNQLFMRSVLEKLGHAVTLAQNGHEAVEYWKYSEFDCILMDIQMPVMTGVEATRAIRDAEAGSQCPEVSGRKFMAGDRTSDPQVSGFIPPPSRHTPIIAVTAHTQPGDRERFLAFGMDDYLGKPVGIKELEKVLEKYTPYHSIPTRQAP
jgi:PAS domain S-box-containing protein